MQTEPPLRAPPAHGWAPCGPEELAVLLEQGGWSLVEFWTPNCLFSRLLLPVRVGMTSSHADRLRLLCCIDEGDGRDFAAFGAPALPALVLFHGRSRVRRWLGATDVALIRFGIDSALSDAGA